MTTSSSHNLECDLDEDCSCRVTPAAAVFVDRVKGCKSLSGFDVNVVWLTSSSAQILARHRYGQWHGITIFACRDGWCETENGNPMRHADIAVKLLKLIRKHG